MDAAARQGPLRAVVHCAGRGGTVRVLQRDGTPGRLDLFETIVRGNLIGGYNVCGSPLPRWAGTSLTTATGESWC
jgi:hypothetical protein